MTVSNTKKPTPLRFGLGVIVIIVVILGMFLGLPWLVLGRDNALELGTVLLWMMGLSLLVAIPVFFINLALDRKGRLLKVIEAVNFVCSLVGVLAGLYVLYVGLESLWEANWKLFLIVMAASAFSIYFYFQKYDRSHPPNSHGQ